MFVPKCYIEIGKLKMQTVHAVRIQKGVHSWVETARIDLPTSAILKHSDTGLTESVDTANVVNAGDKVIIKLGYGDQLQTEFEGYVSRVNYTTPCQIECEGFSWELRSKTFVQTWKNPNLKDLLRDLIAGTDIELHPDMPETTLTGTFQLNAQTALEGFEELKKTHVLSPYFIEGKYLYCGLAAVAQTDKVVGYRLGWNTIKDDQLKYRRAEDAKVQVRVKYTDKKGKEQFLNVGPAGGLVVSRDYGRETDMSALETKAREYAQRQRWAGYEGKMFTFLEPMARHGWAANVTDETYPERSGLYLITSVEVQFGTNGARRIVELGKTLSIK